MSLFKGSIEIPHFGSLLLGGEIPFSLFPEIPSPNRAFFCALRQSAHNGHTSKSNKDKHEDSFPNPCSPQRIMNELNDKKRHNKPLSRWQKWRRKVRCLRTHTDKHSTRFPHTTRSRPTVDTFTFNNVVRVQVFDTLEHPESSAVVGHRHSDTHKQT